jgi:predicted nucleic acid-binding protein
LLDTCLVSHYLSPNARIRYPALVGRVESVISAQGVCLSTVTLYELRRGILELLGRGEGQRKERRLKLFLREATLLGLDGDGAHGWEVAARLYAQCKRTQPALNMSDGDLLIVATAVTHRRALLTSDARLAEQVGRLQLTEAIDVVPLA